MTVVLADPATLYLELLGIFQNGHPCKYFGRNLGRNALSERGESVIHDGDDHIWLCGTGEV